MWNSAHPGAPRPALPPPQTRRARDLSRALGWSDRSGSVGEELVQRFGRLGLKFVAVGSLLAPDAVLGPRHGVQALGFDLLFAMQADPVTAVRNAGQGASHAAKQARFTVQVADGQLALSGELHFIQGVRGLFDGDVGSVPEAHRTLRPLGLQYRFVFFKFGLIHFPSPSSTRPFLLICCLCASLPVTV